jgi:hypothetical protein
MGLGLGSQEAKGKGGPETIPLSATPSGPVEGVGPRDGEANAGSEVPEPSPILWIDLDTDRDRTAAIVFWLSRGQWSNATHAYVVNDIQLQTEVGLVDRALAPADRLAWRDKHGVGRWRLVVFPPADGVDDLRRELRAARLGRIDDETSPSAMLSRLGGEQLDQWSRPTEHRSFDWDGLTCPKGDGLASLRRVVAVGTSLLEACQSKAALLGGCLAVITSLRLEGRAAPERRPLGVPEYSDRVGLKLPTGATVRPSDVVRGFHALHHDGGHP